MLNKIYDYFKQIVALKQQSEKNTSDIKEMKKDINSLNSAVEMLAHEIKRNADKSEYEREIILLQLENRLLKFERRLPPSEDRE